MTGVQTCALPISVIGSRFANRVDQILVGRLIARLAQRLAGRDAAVADLQQQFSRNSGKMRGELGVGHAHLSGMIWRMMKSAASAGVISTVFTRISGASGGS